MQLSVYSFMGVVSDNIGTCRKDNFLIFREIGDEVDIIGQSLSLFDLEINAIECLSIILFLEYREGVSVDFVVLLEECQFLQHLHLLPVVIDGHVIRFRFGYLNY